MASNAKRVPMQAWERHKAKISELVRTHSLEDTRDLMREKYGFEASEKQYLRKLRAWGLAVSYIRKEDWRVIFHYLRELSCQDREFRVVQSGKPLLKSRLDRARRYVKDAGTTNPVIPSPEAGSHHLQNVTIEQKQADGQWTLYKSFADENNRTATVTPPIPTTTIPITQAEGNWPPVIPFSPSNLLLEAAPPHHFPFDDLPGDLFQNGDYLNPVGHDHPMFDEPWASHLGDFNQAIISPRAWGLHSGAGPLSLVESPGNRSTWTKKQEDRWLAENSHQKPWMCTVLDLSKQPLQHGDYVAEASFFWSKLDGLPSARILTLPLVDQIPILRIPTDIPRTLPTAWDRIQNLVQNVVAEAAETEVYPPSWSHRITRDLLRDIRYKFPGLSLCNPNEVGNCQIQGVDIVETLFTRAVVFSMCNGLAGLDSYSSYFIGFMVKRLHRYSGSLSVLSRLLNSSPEHLANSLVETLYEAALMVEDGHMLQWLLSLDKFTHARDRHVYEVFDVVSTIRNGWLARSMLDSGLVNMSGIVEQYNRPGSRDDLLCLHITDVALARDILTTAFQLYPTRNLARTLSTDFCDRLRFDHRRETALHVRDRYAPVARTLMQHGATIEPTLLALLVTGDSTDDPFFKSLCESTLGVNHGALIEMGWFLRHSVLCEILFNLKDDHAAVFLKRFQEECQATGCGQCLTDETILGELLRKAASHESCQLMQSLLPYATHSTLTIILCLAIRSGWTEIVQLLVEEIDHVSRPQDVGESISHRADQYSLKILETTTPLAEAIMAQNDELVAMMESRGGLEDLDPDCWGALLTAAVATSNDNYITKLQRVPFNASSTPRRGCPQAGLWLAVIKNQQSMFDMLFDGPAGMDGARSTGTMPTKFTPEQNAWRHLPLIMVAFETRNEHIVLRLLGDGDIGLAPRQENWLFQEAVRWGSRRVLEALIRLSPGFRMESFFRHGRENKFSCLLCDEEDHEEDREEDSVVVVDCGDQALGEIARQDMPGVAFLVESGVMATTALNDVLQSAIYQGDEYLFQALLDLGADPFPNDSAVTSLARAVRSHNANMLQLLLDKISHDHFKRHDIRIGALYGLQEAIAEGTGGTEALDTLLRSGLLDPATLNTTFLPSIRIDNHTSRPRTTILYHAIQACARGTNDDCFVVQKLLTAGSDVNRVVYEGNRGDWPSNSRSSFNEDDGEELVQHDGFTNYTALVSAVYTGHRALVEMLLKHEADPNEELGYGKKRTPLQAAAEIGSLPIVKLLLERGADVNARPAFQYGATAFQFAAIRGNPVMAAELLRHGADLAQAPSRVGGRWPLEGAAEHGRIAMIEYLCTICPEGFPESQWQTAIALARDSKRHACATFLEKLHSSFQDTGSFENVINGDNLQRVLLDSR